MNVPDLLSLMEIVKYSGTINKCRSKTHISDNDYDVEQLRPSTVEDTSDSDSSQWFNERRGRRRRIRNQRNADPNSSFPHITPPTTAGGYIKNPSEHFSIVDTSEVISGDSITSATYTDDDYTFIGGAQQPIDEQKMQITQPKVTGISLFIYIYSSCFISHYYTVVCRGYDCRGNL